MASTFFKDLIDAAESGAVAVGIPAGTYDVAVTDARANIKRKDDGTENKTIFLTLQALNGPVSGKATEVNLYFPKDGDKPFATTKFLQKINGFVAYPDIKAAFMQADNAPDAAAALDLIASTLIGKQVSADIGLRTDGDFAGSNELSKTRPLTGPTTTGGPVTDRSHVQPFVVPQPAAQGAGNNAAPGGVTPF